MSGRHVRQADGSARTGVPPRPDPCTGEPAPPAAPAYRGPDLPTGHNPGADRRVGRRPSPPPGSGPVLCAYRPSLRGRAFRLLLAVAILVAGSAILSVLQGDGLALLSAWPVWPVIVIGAVLMARPYPVRTISVGSDWLQRSGRRREHVRLYELTRIEAGRAQPPVRLLLADSDQALLFRLDELQPDRAAWNLIFNGIRHSVATGARIDDAALRLLHLQR